MSQSLHAAALNYIYMEIAASVGFSRLTDQPDGSGAALSL